MEGVFYAKAAAFIGAALAIGIGTIGPALGQGRVGAQALESMGKYPEQADKIRGAMILSLALLETIALYSLLIAGGLIVFNS